MIKGARMKYINVHIVVMHLTLITWAYAMVEDVKNNPHFAYSKHVLDDHLKNLSEFDSIIDFGCRDGITTHYLYRCTRPKVTSKIIGLDPSLRHIIAAKTRQVAHLLQPAKLPAVAAVQQLTRKESFSSSPLEVSTLSSSCQLEVGIQASADLSKGDGPLEDFPFYQRTLTSEETSAQAADLSTSLVHIQDIDSRDRLAFYVDNLVTLSYKESRARLVTSFNNLHTFTAKENFFESVCALFKDNGILLMTTQLESPHITTILALLQKKVTETPWKEAFANFYAQTAYAPVSSMEALRTLLKKYKFNKAEIVSEERYCTNKQNVSSYLEHEFYAFNQFVSLSSEQKKQLCDSIAQEYMLHFPAKNGSIPLPNTVIVKAQRHLYAPFSGIGWKH